MDASALYMLLKLNVLFFLLVKLYLTLTVGKCKSRRRMDGKVVIITGANSGIGKETARDLALRGARVILACRNAEKAAAAAKEIKEEEPSAKLTIHYIDCCDLESIRVFANKIIEEEEKIDVLINNAGTAPDNSRLTCDGFEETHQINYLAPVLLTELLLPLMKKSAPSRVINVVSSNYVIGRCNVDTLPDDLRSLSRIHGLRYCDSKLLLLMYSKALHQEIGNSGVTVTAVHPGVVRTGLALKKFSLTNLVLAPSLLLWGRSPEEGAQTLIHLSVASIRSSEDGQYWADCAPTTTWVGNNSGINYRIMDTTRRILKIDKYSHGEHLLHMVREA